MMMDLCAPAMCNHCVALLTVAPPICTVRDAREVYNELQRMVAMDNVERESGAGGNADVLDHHAANQIALQAAQNALSAHRLDASTHDESRVVARYPLAGVRQASALYVPLIRAALGFDLRMPLHARVRDEFVPAVVWNGMVSTFRDDFDARIGEGLFNVGDLLFGEHDDYLQPGQQELLLHGPDDVVHSGESQVPSLHPVQSAMLIIMGCYGLGMNMNHLRARLHETGIMQRFEELDGDANHAMDVASMRLMKATVMMLLATTMMRSQTMTD
jgi:hypothetical protein